MSIEDKIRRINAIETNYETQECWVDDDGKKHYINRKPINWGYIAQKGAQKQ